MHDFQALLSAAELRMNISPLLAWLPLCTSNACLNAGYLQDGHNTEWDPALIQGIVQQEVARHKIQTVRPPLDLHTEMLVTSRTTLAA